MTNLSFWTAYGLGAASLLLGFGIFNESSCGAPRREIGLQVISCVDGGQSIEAKNTDGVIHTYGFRKSYPSCYTWTQSKYWDVDLDQCRSDFYYCRVMAITPVEHRNR